MGPHGEGVRCEVGRSYGATRQSGRNLTPSYRGFPARMEYLDYIPL